MNCEKLNRRNTHGLQLSCSFRQLFALKSDCILPIHSVTECHFISEVSGKSQKATPNLSISAVHPELEMGT